MSCHKGVSPHPPLRSAGQCDTPRQPGAGARAISGSAVPAHCSTCQHRRAWCSRSPERRCPSLSLLRRTHGDRRALRARPCASRTAAGHAGGSMSTRAASHRVSAPCTHRLAGARAPLCLHAENPACSLLSPRWRAQTAAFRAAPPSIRVLADARRNGTHRAATPALDSNLHSAVPPPMPSPMARGFLPRGLSDAYLRLQ